MRVFYFVSCIVLLISFLSFFASACASGPCLVFNSTQTSSIWSNLQASQFKSYVPQSATTSTLSLANSNAGGNLNDVPENAAAHCLLNSSNSVSSNSCSTTRSEVDWFFTNINTSVLPLTTSLFSGGGAAPVSGRVVANLEAFNWLRAKGVYASASQEEQTIIQKIEEIIPTFEAAFASIAWESSAGNAALDNYDIPIATAIYFLYMTLDGNTYTTFSSSTVANKIFSYLGYIRNGLHDYDSIPPEGMNYHVYSMPFAIRAALTAEANNQFNDMFNQSLLMGNLIGDVYMGSGVGQPTSSFDSGRGFMWEIESSYTDKGLKGFTPSYLLLLGRLHGVDSWTAKRGISRLFEIYNILGNGAYYSEQLGALNPYLLPALYYNQSISYPSNLDQYGYLPAGFYRDQKNSNPPSGRYNFFDTIGDGGLHISFNKLSGSGRVGSLYIVRDGYMQHLHGSEDGSTEKYSGSFPVEVSPGRGAYPSPGVGHRRIDQNIFLSSADQSAASSNFNYYEPASLADSQHNYGGKFKYHLEGRFASGAEGEHKRIWMMDCVTCKANRIVIMIGEPDNESYVLEYAETQDNSPGVYDKRSHSLVQATNYGNGYKVEYSGSKGVTRFFYPTLPKY